MSLENWAIIPAAGVGKRMRSSIPKQYLAINGRTVLDHTIGRLLAHEQIRGVVVALSAEDEWWPQSVFAQTPNVLVAEGGKERCHSVLNALNLLSGYDNADLQVLVHDAARPCVRMEDVSRLIEIASQSDHGALLGMPVRDTMKRTDKHAAVTSTVDREHLWHAFTPQMFRLSLLKNALQSALDNHQLVTDDASAMELSGYKPVMVESAADNIKITRPEDLSLAAYYLAGQDAQV